MAVALVSKARMPRRARLRKQGEIDQVFMYRRAVRVCVQVVMPTAQNEA